MYQQLLQKEKQIAVIGLGYVGLPIALEFAKYFRVIGFDINESRVAMMQAGQDPSHELDSAVFEGKDIVFTANPEDLRQAHFFIVAVPTPVDDYKVPDLKPLIGASHTGIMSSMSQPFIRAVRKKIAYPFSKKNRI